MAKHRLGLALALLFIGSCYAIEMKDGTCEPGDANYLDANPLGTCVCDGHLYVSEDCREGFFCTDTTGHGCYKQCPEGQFLVTDIGRQTWTCLKEGQESLLDENIDGGFKWEDDKILKQCPIGGFNLCPSISGTQAPIPDENQVSANPLGTCRCNGELWVSEGCSFGFVCDDTQEKGGFLKTCPNGEIVLIDWETNTWDCSTKTEYCPGAQINGVGCKQPNCEMGQNTLGQCSDNCDGQFFISDDCTEGFLCTTNIPDPYLYDGCIKKCLNGQVLVTDFENENWKCVDKSEWPSYKCPGKFNLECPGSELSDGDFDSTMCTCSGELLVSSDCKEAFYCLPKFPNGGRALKCGGNTILELNLLEYSWKCVEDKGQCPKHMGGFRAGCGQGNEIPPIDERCEFGENTIGECQCPGQIFINEDCTKSFYCTTDSPDEEPGCHKECAEGEVVMVDFANKGWTCEKKPDGFMCPGEFSLDCPESDDFEIKCNCAGEVWVNNGCDMAFTCESEYKGGSNQGTFQTCQPGTILDIDFTKPAGEYECTDKVENCPGSFHYGCNGSSALASISLLLLTALAGIYHV